LVHSSIHDEFVDRLATEVEGLKMGDPSAPATDIGPVVSEAHLQKVRAAVEKAVSNGAQVPLLSLLSMLFSHSLTSLDRHWRAICNSPFQRILLPADNPLRHPLSSCLLSAILSFLCEGMPQSCEIVQEEVFGPVVTVQKFDTVQEVCSLLSSVP
jgi:hypothetical protein